MRLAASPSRGATAFLLAAALATPRCASSPDRTPRAAERVAVISFDGLGGVRLNRLLADGKLDAGGFAAFAERGLFAGRAIDVTPSLTPAAHISAITGAPPSATGIVSNSFRTPGSPFGRATTGFTAEIETETLWEAARRQKKRVAVLLYPGADGTSERRRGDLGLVWPDLPVKESAILALGSDRFEAAVPGTARARSFSPVRQARVEITVPGGHVLRLRLVAVDTTDDGATNYDLLEITREDQQAPAPAVAVGRRGWFELSLGGPEASLTSWCRVREIDPGLASVSLYVGAFWRVPAYPESFRSRIEKAAGGWPGAPDNALTRAGRTQEDEQAAEEQALRLADYLTKVLVYTIQSERWDLLIGYQPLVDEVEHAFEPGPGGGSREAVERAFKAADRSVAALLGALTPRDALFIMSDHGMVPLRYGVNLDLFLSQKGWTVVRDESAPPGSRRVQICTSSGIAHVYLDPALPKDQREAALSALLTDLRALASLPGEVVDEVLEKVDLARVGLDNPRSGDAVVLLKPGAVFTRSSASVVGPARLRGGHGYRVGPPELDASLLAIGPGIAKERPATVSLLEVAARAARALGIETPRGPAPVP